MDHAPSATLTREALGRIQRLDQAGPRLRSVLEVNPDALEVAKALDAERSEKGPRSALHGHPVLLKDNLETADRMATAAGSLALLQAPPPQKDSEVAARLRKAGMVLLGKTNMSEWANFRSTRSSGGWSGRGGQCRNPHVLDRNPSGSSSGSAVAVAAGLCAFAIGTETNGSIVSPSAACGIVGLKPTLGLVSRAGIIPLAHSFDTAGPMARTVSDAALLLGLMAGEDPRDPATEGAKVAVDYTSFLDPDGLRGTRLGLVRGFLGLHPHVDPVLETSLALLRKMGAEITEVELPLPETADRERLFQQEFKADLNAYLAHRGGPYRTLEDLIRFNQAEAAREMPWFKQELFEASQGRGPLSEPEYLQALARVRRIAGKEGIDRVAAAHRLDALIAPTAGPAPVTDLLNNRRGGGFGCSTWAALAGYPHLTVPMGFTHDLPLNLSFFGPAWSEGVLLRLGYAFEQARQALRIPGFRPSLDL